MYKEEHKIIGEEFNPFTRRYEKIYSYDSSLKWVPPKVIPREKIVSNYKAICSGNVIEIWEYEQPNFYGFEKKGEFTGKRKIGEDFKKRRDKVLSAKFKLRRLINSNVNKNTKFVTLTFAENLQDVSIAKDKFKVFIRKMNRQRIKKGKENLKYVYVVEFQERGAIHFHCVFFNLDYIKNEDLYKNWKNGYTWINRVEDVDNVGAYVVKYMEKTLEDPRLNGRDLYGRSKGNLKESLEIKRPRVVKEILEAYKNKISYEKTYTSDYNGQIKYMQIKLDR